MMKRKILACPDCKRKYTTLTELNRHIGQTKCYQGITVSIVEIFVACGILKETPIVDYNLQSPIPAI